MIPQSMSVVTLEHQPLLYLFSLGIPQIRLHVDRKLTQLPGRKVNPALEHLVSSKPSIPFYNQCKQFRRDAFRAQRRFVCFLRLV